MIRTAVEHAAKRIPIIAGVGGNSTAEAIELTKHAKAVGGRDAAGRAVLQQADAGRHVPSLQDDRRSGRPAGDPGTTCRVARSPTWRTRRRRLAEVPGIIGVKEATGNIDRAAHLIKAAPKHFAILAATIRPRSH